jgi:TolB protein
VVGIAVGTPRQLTSGEAGEVYPRYSPDGTFVLFHTWGTSRRVGRVSARGGPATFLPLGGPATFADISPDGKTLIFARPDEKSERIYTVPVDGGEPRLLTASPGSVPRFSPKGDLIAFAANRDYRAGIFVINRDGSNERRLTSEGSWPVWWPDGAQIGFLTVGPDGDQEIGITTLDGQIRKLDKLKLRGTNLPFAVLPDGRHIAISNAVHMSDEIWLRSPGR